MKKNIIIGFLALSIVCFLGSSAVISEAATSGYCQVPAFIASVGEPNVLFVDDVSGSMGWSAYQTTTDRDKNCSLSLSTECDRDSDCTYNYGTCGLYDGHYRCSAYAPKHCSTNSDCVRNLGTCVSTTALYYGTCSNNATIGCEFDTTCAPGTCVPRKAYEGYFTPAKYYKLVGGEYVETVATGTACTATCLSSRCYRDSDSCATRGSYGSGPGAFGCITGSRQYGCCTDIQVSGDCNLLTGNYLNWKYMARIDLLRWAVTGGRPYSCTGTKTFTDAECDPELWNETGNSTKVGSVCNNTLTINDYLPAITGGCKLLANNNTTIVRVPWSRMNDGLTSTFSKMPVKPKLGAMSYDSTSVRAQKVYVGDFLASNNNDSKFPYKQFITHVNSHGPGGTTPTGPAMWDAYNYFAQNAAQYGGFTQQTGAGDKWKNPLYVCDGLEGKPGGGNCTLNVCAKNYLILMSDGEWNQGGKPGFVASTQTIDTGVATPANLPTMASDDRSADPVVPAYLMHKGFTNAGANIATQVNGVYTIGLFLGTTGETAMKNVAMYGGFDNSTKTWPDSLSNYTVSTTNCLNKGSLCTPLPASSVDWDKNADGVPDTYFTGDSATEIRQAILDAILDILAKVSSGTAASVLASGEGSGANLVQAVFYPRKKFYDNSIAWIGWLQNLWYYIDPNFANSNIREEGGTTKDYKLNLLADGLADNKKDYTLKLYFDTTEQRAKAKRYYDLTGTGAGALGTPIDTVDFESLGNLWEAGKLLWNRSAASRNIYTSLTATYPKTLTVAANAFSTANLATIRPLLNTDEALRSITENNTAASNIIDYVRGVDLADYTAGGITDVYRSRTVSIDLNGNGIIDPGTVTVGRVPMYESAKVWKLGDIINSTPRISSWMALQGYDTVYGDISYGSFIATTNYKSRGMVFTGANDGMLHAFKLGLFGTKWTGQNTNYEKAILGSYCSGNTAKVCDSTGTGGCDAATEGFCTADSDIGQEVWAFIPRTVLPYLKYLKEADYCHIYSVDLTPVLVDASICAPGSCPGDYWQQTKDINSWRTILIGGMRTGGACRQAGSLCTNCVKTPVAGNGYSSYFALDVTDHNAPVLLWEFSDENLGFSTSGPAIVRISARTQGVSESAVNKNANGRWFVVFGSGPTGPIDMSSQQFLAKSDQNLRLFILDLKTGNVERTIVMDGTGTPATPIIAEAFAGSLVNAAHDSYRDLDYQDDVVYIGYTKKNSVTGEWTDGGVLRLMTNEDQTGNNVSGTTAGTTALNPATWLLSEAVSGTGSVTTSVQRLENKTKGILWLYFGSGRFYYQQGVTADDSSSIRQIYGIKEPCYTGAAGYIPTCTTTIALSAPLCSNPAGSPPCTLPLRNYGVKNTTDENNRLTADELISPSVNGWYINLDKSGPYTYSENGVNVTGNYAAERIITDPLSSTIGVVFFTSYKPAGSACNLGGKTFLWAVKYDTGGAAGSLLQGKALIQVSTGSIEQLDMSTAFTDAGGRKSAAMEGVPPTAQGLSIMTGPAPLKKIIHIKER